MNLKPDRNIRPDTARGLAKPGRRQTVLIIEDETLMRNLLQALLESMGCQSTSVPGPRAAQDLIRRKTFDAILLDLHCSNATPEEVISWILEIRPQLIRKVVLINGEIPDAKTMNAVEHHGCPVVYRDRIVRDVWNALQRVFQASLPREAA